jgi:hypothetical protein
MVHELRDNKSPEAQTLDTFRVCEKLRPHLATLMGTGGFRALLTRALVLTNGEVAGLRTVRVNEAGLLEQLEEFRAQNDAKKFFEGGVVLVAHLLALLVAFIGEDLTVRLVREVWPDVSLDHLGFR